MTHATPCISQVFFITPYESTAVVHDRSSLEVMDFGKTRTYRLWMCGPLTMGLRVYGRSLWL